MSAEAMGWVYRHSPYRGTEFAVHLALADSANDQNAYRLWLAIPTLASKARVSRGMVGRALARMVDDGYLQPLTTADQARARNQAREYRFIFAEGAEVVHETRPSRDDESPLARPPREPRATTARSTQGEPKENPITRADVLSDGFDEWYQGYPRKIARRTAEKAYRTLRRAGVQPEELLRARDGYAEAMRRAGTEARFVLHPSTFLHDDRWRDYLAPPPARPGSEFDAYARAAFTGFG